MVVDEMQEAVSGLKVAANELLVIVSPQTVSVSDLAIHLTR